MAEASEKGHGDGRIRIDIRVETFAWVLVVSALRVFHGKNITEANVAGGSAGEEGSDVAYEICQGEAR